MGLPGATFFSHQLTKDLTMSLKTFNRRTWLMAAGASAVSTSPLWAQSSKYPARNIRMIVPFPATGGPDTVGRLVALMLSQKWGQQIVVENMPGASGQIGTNYVVKAPADGYTLLFAPPTPITIAQHFDPKPAYDPTKDLVPASLMGRNPAVIVVNSKVPANNLGEFFALVKKNPDKYFYGSPGLGHAFHLISEIIFAKAGVTLTHIPYQGSAPAVMGLLGGDVQFLVQSVESVKEHIKAGKLRALATLEANRLDAYPDLPTLAESGLSNLDIMNWYGAFFTAKTPSEVIAFWEHELALLAKDAAYQKRMREMSFDPVVYGSQEFSKMMALESVQWAGVIKSAKIVTQK
jgi:tripartite-type tricarboxylate transporter receptor subunit TctC